MKKTKVIIMSFKGSKTVTYTDDGQFIYVPRKKHHQVGEILLVADPAFSSRRFSPGWQAMTAAAAVIMLFFFGLFYPLTSQQAEAYFSLGLNKGSAELWVDRDNRVIDVKYTGAVHLETLDVKGKDVYQAISDIATETRKTGLLNESDENLMLINFADMSKAGNPQVNEAKIREAVLNGVNSDESKSFMVMSRHDQGYMAKAGDMGLTASQYYVLEQSKAKGLPLTAEQLKNTTIRSALKEVGTTPEELFGMPGMQRNIEERRGMMPTRSQPPVSSSPDAISKMEHAKDQKTQAIPFTGTHQEKQRDETLMQGPQYRGSMEQQKDNSTMMKTTTQGRM